jgi:hypothetical protein
LLSAGKSLLRKRCVVGGALPPALSVVLPNYNYAEFLDRALQALVAQELKADEIIVIDDD